MWPGIPDPLPKPTGVRFRQLSVYQITWLANTYQTRPVRPPKTYLVYVVKANDLYNRRYSTLRANAAMVWPLRYLLSWAAAARRDANPVQLPTCPCQLVPRQVSCQRTGSSSLSVALHWMRAWWALCVTHAPDGATGGGQPNAARTQQPTLVVKSVLRRLTSQCHCLVLGRILLKRKTASRNELSWKMLSTKHD